ncbi:calcium/sodium antiporter [Planctomycetota bacterium]
MSSLLLLIAGFALLIKGADWLVDGGSALGKRFGISDLVIGLTVVAFGTSMPELFVNVIAGVKGSTDLAIGNVLGSNISNILLILGTSAIIFPLHVGTGTVWKEIPFSLLAVLVLAVMANDRLLDRTEQSVLSRSDGMVLLGFFAIFLYYSAAIAHQTPDSLINETPKRLLSSRQAGWYILLGMGGLALGGYGCVTSAIQMARKLHVSESLIGLTVVAIGTSLPELATSVTAACKKNCDIAVGNIVGSNIFNIFLILGISTTVRPLPMAAHSSTDIAVVILATMVLFTCMFTGKRKIIDRWEGGLMLASYVLYITYLIHQG